MATHRYVIQTVMVGSLLLLHFTNTTRADEPVWPQFRGPNCSGLATEGQNPPVKFGPEQNMIWKTPVLPGHSSPCMWSDHIFLTGFDKDKKQLQVFCVGRTSGKIQWSRTVSAEKIERVHSVSNPAASTPATDGERVYVYFGSYGLICYDFTGKQQWNIPLPIPQTRDGHATSPIVTGELVIINSKDPNMSYLLAVDRKSGETIWKQPQQSISENGSATQSTPIIWEKQLVLHRGGELAAYDIADGARTWSISIVTRGTSTPIVSNNVFFVSAWTNFGEPDLRVKLPDFGTMVKQHDKDGDMNISKSEFPDDLAVARRPEVGNIEGGQFYVKPYFNMVDSNKDGLIGETEWTEVVGFVSSLTQEHGLMAIKPGEKDDVTATYILWQEKKNVAEVPSPLYYKGRVYMVKNGGIVSCMDAESGKMLYCERLGTPGPYYSSPIIANSRIYTASGKGIIAVFEAGDKLQILAKNDLKEQIFATPAVVDNKLYVRTVKHLYAFGE